MREGQFVLLGTQRSGSVYVQDLISSHPDAHCWGEVLLGMDGPTRSGYPNVLARRRRARHVWQAVRSGSALTPVRVLERAWNDRGERAVGMRIMYNQLRPSVVRHLTSTRTGIVHLVRSNSLRQYVSQIQMRQRQTSLGAGSAHSSTPTTFDPVRVDPRRAMQYITARRDETQRISAHFRDQTVATLEYERDIQGGEVTTLAEVLLPALGLDHCELAGRTQRTGGAALDALVCNYPEVAREIQSTEFGWMLED